MIWYITVWGTKTAVSATQIEPLRQRLTLKPGCAVLTARLLKNTGATARGARGHHRLGRKYENNLNIYIYGTTRPENAAVH